MRPTTDWEKTVYIKRGLCEKGDMGLTLESDCMVVRVGHAPLSLLIAYSYAIPCMNTSVFVLWNPTGLILVPASVLPIFFLISSFVDVFVPNKSGQCGLDGICE